MIDYWSVVFVPFENIFLDLIQGVTTFDEGCKYKALIQYQSFTFWGTLSQALKLKGICRPQAG